MAESTSSDSPSPVQRLFKCRKCPGKLFTLEEKEAHRDSHRNNQSRDPSIHDESASSSASLFRVGLDLYTCRLCPGRSFTPSQRDTHRDFHERQQATSRASTSRSFNSDSLFDLVTMQDEPLDYSTDRSVNPEPPAGELEEAMVEGVHTCVHCPGEKFTGPEMVVHLASHRSQRRTTRSPSPSDASMFERVDRRGNPPKVQKTQQQAKAKAAPRRKSKRTKRVIKSKKNYNELITGTWSRGTGA